MQVKVPKRLVADNARHWSGIGAMQSLAAPPGLLAGRDTRRQGPAV